MNDTITSRQNAVIKKFRSPCDSIVVEGKKLIYEAISAGFVIEHLLFTEKSRVNDLPQLKAFVITSQLSEYISDTKSPQGIFAMFARPQSALKINDAALLAVLDDVQDPGNVGAIARSCEAFGFSGIILSDNCADMFNRKVIRAAAGAVFRLPHLRGNLREILPRLKQSGFTLYASGLDDTAVSLANVVPSAKTAVVIGNEGSGICDEVTALCDCKLYIPIKGVQSLNAGVAAGIIFYELSQFGGNL
jgi:TrmH family RNA methyltransferase